LLALGELVREADHQFLIQQFVLFSNLRHFLIGGLHRMTQIHALIGAAKAGLGFRRIPDHRQR